MRKTRTRILSLLMALVMCLSLLPVTALAEGTYTIIFDAAGGTFPDGSATQSIQTLSVGVIEYYPDEPTRQGYTFVNWGGMSADELKYHRFTSDETVYAIWESNPAGTSYTITFDANGGKFPDGSAAKDLPTKKVGEDNLVDGYPPEPAREGYTFEGWYRNSPGEYPSVFNYNFTSDATVYANWKKIGSGSTSGFTITFAPNGGIVSPTTKQTDADGRVPGGYPTPTREGYKFLGWFTDGDGYQPKEDEIWSGNQTLVAKWEKTAGAVRVDFYPNGGRITEFKGITVPEPNGGYPFTVDDVTGVDMNSGIGWTNTEDSGLLTALPSVEREGYTFDGWYFITATGLEASQAYDGKLTDFSTLTKFDPGQKIGILTELAAKWVVGETYTVTFDLNGATGTAPTPQKVAKGKTVELPVLKASGAEFMGWGYSTDGKTLIEWKAEYPVTGNLTLYAMWNVQIDDVLKGLTYRFGNDHSAYGYKPEYNIPLDRYQLIFGNNELAKALYDYDTAADKKWGGSCYGMSTTSTMFFEQIVSTTSFKSGSTVPYDLEVSNQNRSWNLSLTQYIEAMQISQKAQRVQKQITQNKNNLSALQAAVKISPVIVTIYGPEGGHAVVGYDVKTVTNASGQRETGLMIYDPNYPNQEKHITLSGGSGWSYYMGKMYVSGKLTDVTWSSGNGWISYIPYTVTAQVWSDRGSENNFYNTMNLISISANNATISNSAGEVVATIQGGKVSSFRGDVTPIYETDIAMGGTSIPAMWLPTEQYTVTNTGSESQFTVSMVNVDQSATVNTTASNVTFLVDDSNTVNSVQISGAGKRYDITLSSSLNQGYKEVTLTGTTSAETTAVAQISGKLYGTNLDTNGTLKVDGTSSDNSILAGTVPQVSVSQPAQPTGTNPFTDVKSSAYYYDAVMWAVKNNVTSGTSSTTFSPDASCTRGQIVTFLWRAAGSPKPTNTQNPFTDVKSGAYYYDAVLWAVEKGITSGTSATTFSPDASCTRGQTVTFLYRAAGSPKAASSSNPFTDVTEGAYYYDAVLWAVEQNVTSGTSATTFSPNATVTRGQTVTFLYRSQGK